MIELVCAKTHDHWQVTDDENCTVVVIDIDTVNRDRDIEQLAANAHGVITYGNRIIQGEYLALTKPLRTASLLKCLCSVLMTLDGEAHYVQRTTAKPLAVACANKVVAKG